LGWTYTVRSVGCGLAIGWRAFWTVSMLMPGSFEPEYQLKKELAQILEAAIRDAKIPLVPNVVIGSPGGQGGYRRPRPAGFAAEWRHQAAGKTCDCLMKQAEPRAVLRLFLYGMEGERQADIGGEKPTYRVYE